jgi:hypothetical protein
MYVLCSGMSIQSITEEQFYLASRAHIPLSESNQMADFEREAFMGLVVQDIKQQTENDKLRLAANMGRSIQK